jgi:hypothetical protein
MLLSAHGDNSDRTETHISHLGSEPSSPEDRVLAETFKRHINRQVLIKFGGGGGGIIQTGRKTLHSKIHGRDSV